VLVLQCSPTVNEAHVSHHYSTLRETAVHVYDDDVFIHELIIWLPSCVLKDVGERERKSLHNSENRGKLKVKVVGGRELNLLTHRSKLTSQCRQHK
jgi:hypothetical protein